MHQQRKSDHIRINLEEDVAFQRVAAGFDRYSFTHCALPELDLDEVDTTTELLGKTLALPLIVASMTGGTVEARTINEGLAAAAQGLGVGLGLGSQRAAIEDPVLARTYQVRHIAPDILLLANLGAVQLNYGYGPAECRRAVEMVEADALILHLNPLQEALQPDGDTRFAGLLRRIESVCNALEVPVVVKEVGWGMSAKVARQLASAGVAALDVAGAGGTSWSQVEMHRAQTESARRVAAAFADWGIPTVESLLSACAAAPDVDVIASGGIRDGIQMAKAMALGAKACSIASPFLHASSASHSAAAELIRALSGQMKIAMFAAGVPDIASLRQTRLTRADN